MTRTLVPDLGTCRDCMRRREVFSISRLNGGNYRIAPRWRSSSICGECASRLLAHATPGQGSRGWSASTLRNIVASLDSDEARETLATYDARQVEHEARKAADEVSLRAFWDRIHERRQAISWISAQQHVEGMDATTCRAIAGGIKRGEAGNENTGAVYESGQDTRWERTIRQQVIDYIHDPAVADLDAVTLSVLADGIRDALHRPDPKDT